MSPSLQDTADLFTFIEEMLNGKFNFYCTEILTDSEQID